jgi:hypothetical protein
MLPFRLVPFALEPPVGKLSLTGTVDVAGAALRAVYRLSGDRSAVVIPSPVAEPTRREGLWRATCFELFAAQKGQPGYLEINLSPSGDWQAYSFVGYRDGMAPLLGARFTSYRRELGETELEIGFELMLVPQAPFTTPGDLFDIAVTAVLEHSGGTRSYWALGHFGDRPDFHRRDSFLLHLRT